MKARCMSTTIFGVNPPMPWRIAELGADKNASGTPRDALRLAARWSLGTRTNGVRRRSTARGPDGRHRGPIDRGHRPVLLADRIQVVDILQLGDRSQFCTRRHSARLVEREHPQLVHETSSRRFPVAVHKN
jgi:hypothetical protein